MPKSAAREETEREQAELGHQPRRVSPTRGGPEPLTDEESRRVADVAKNETNRRFTSWQGQLGSSAVTAGWNGWRACLEHLGVDVAELVGLRDEDEDDKSDN